MATVTIHNAKTQLSKLIARAQAGEEIIIARGKEPVVRLTAISSDRQPLQPGIVKGKRVPGLLKEIVTLPDSFFFDPLPEGELKLWEGSDDDHLG